MSAMDANYYSNPESDYTVYRGSPSTQYRNPARPRSSEKSPMPNYSNAMPPAPAMVNPRLKSENPYSTNFTSFDNKPMPGANTGSPERGLKHLFSVYADKCSLNGIIFIKSSKYWVVKLIWTLLLLGAIGMMFYHLYRLGKNYYSYGKQSKVDLKFANLPFPAVTVCNVNALRHSRRHDASKKLNDLIDSINPEKMAEEVNDWEPEYEEDYYHYDEDGELISGDGSGSGSGARRKRSTSASNITVKHRKNNFFDDFNFTSFDDTHSEDFEGSTYTDSWEAESEPAAFDQISNQFINLYSKENGTVRQQMGHQIQDMLIQCSFSGRKCVSRNFTLVSTATLGNCYTIEYTKFVARSSGPREGLSLMLYIESDEYVPGITTSKGVQVVIHEPKTLPFPDDEGLSASAGMETTIGLRRLSISRLDEPYGECTDTDDFKKEYGIKYTRQACQEICEMEVILDKCSCFDATKPFVYNFLKKKKTSESCQKSTEKVSCMKEVQWDFQSDFVSCKCDSPCSEVQYRKTVSTRAWPEHAFATLMAQTLCKENNYLCDWRDRNVTELRENFVKVTVFFETLNYESLSEEADYSEFQFISDIGGTVGLYVGLSVLSMCEVLHLLFAILRYLCCGNWSQN